MKTRHILTAIAVAMTLSFAANAGNMNMHSGKGNTQMTMHDAMSNMHSEMEAIINTEDPVKRKALFTAHEERVHEKMTMLGNTGISGHQEDNRAIEVLEEYQTD